EDDVAGPGVAAAGQVAQGPGAVDAGAVQDDRLADVQAGAQELDGGPGGHHRGGPGGGVAQGRVVLDLEGARVHQGLPDVVVRPGQDRRAGARLGQVARAGDHAVDGGDPGVGDGDGVVQAGQGEAAGPREQQVVGARQGERGVVQGDGVAQ